MNAFEAVSHGPGEVCLSAQLVHMNEEYCRPCGPCLEKKIGPFACIEVKDNGVGMSLDQKRRAFEPYFSTKGKGRGLGLSVAWGIVREHGGCMVIDSEEGEGTSIRIHIPVAETGATSAEKIPVTLG
jgi:signal transduction histidine kinase